MSKPAFNDVANLRSKSVVASLSNLEFRWGITMLLIRGSDVANYEFDSQKLRMSLNNLRRRYLAAQSNMTEAGVCAQPTRHDILRIF